MSEPSRVRESYGALVAVDDNDDTEDERVEYEIRVINLDEELDEFGNATISADPDENFILTLDGRRVVFVRVRD